jgi:3-isopropylmalate/(R)-2-methylmalate dehydratase large subunit|tara:strand:- start:5304 stop:6731 length:1428 start_codon:yes stop_codon:yes gene_type:complete
MASTLAEKLWESHVVGSNDDGTDVIYVDLHLVHEVSSPQAFEGLRDAGRRVRRPDATLATMDHNVPTSNRSLPMTDELAARQMATLRDNCVEFDIPLLDLFSPRQGIVHMIGPELGLTRPGISVACGDSHTPTHGAFGALALGVGTSVVEQVLASQCLTMKRPGTMSVDLVNQLQPGVTAKDVVLHMIARLGVGGGAGHIIEFRGPAVDAMSMEARMTLCNMVSECGARSALIAPDETTFAYLRERRHAPQGAAWDAAVEDWSQLRTDADAVFDTSIVIDVSTVEPTVTWGTTPSMSCAVTGRVPRPEETDDPELTADSLSYMGLAGGEAITDLKIDRVFIGSCTNARIEDLREAAAMIAGRRVADSVRAMVVAGSQSVKRQAEDEGLDTVFTDAGFEWREPGCSMCLGMNQDILGPGERCASTSNRNYKGRQGAGGRTHLVSPAMAAAAAVHGRFVDIRDAKRDELSETHRGRS